MTQRNPIVNWRYGTGYLGLHNLVDPRIAIARQLAWSRPSTNTTDYTVPEPENYNRAIYTITPMELPWVQDQVIYKEPHKPGWITACYLTEEQAAKFDEWAALMDMTYWRHLRPAIPRKQRPMLERGATKAEMSLDERLLTQGYYKNMVIKYFDGDPLYVTNRLGPARASLIDLFNDE
jgi:hypothetical protein